MPKKIGQLTRDELILAFMPLANSVALSTARRDPRFSRCGSVDLNDARSEGRVALVVAVDSYDSSLGTLDNWVRFKVRWLVLTWLLGLDDRSQNTLNERITGHLVAENHLIAWQELTDGLEGVEFQVCELVYLQGHSIRGAAGEMGIPATRAWLIHSAAIHTLRGTIR